MEKYTQAQIKDITERETRALGFLKDMELTPAAQVTKVMVGNDVFADKVTPFLQDLKYSKKADEPMEETEELVED